MVFYLSSYDSPGLAPLMIVLFQGQLDFHISFSGKDMSGNVWNCLLGCSIVDLKLYCRYLYTRPCMINHIWGLKQLWLQVNGHAWFHLQRLRWPVRNGRERKIQNENICLQRDSNPHPASPRQESCSALDRSATRDWWWSVVKCLAG